MTFPDLTSTPPRVRTAWAGAVAVGAAGVGTVFALSLVLALLLDLPRVGLWDEVVLAGAFTASAFGVDGTLAADYLDNGTHLELGSHLGGIPLVLGIVGLGLSAYLFHRQVRATATLAEGLRQALRTALVVGALLLLLALVLRTDLSSLWGHVSRLGDLDVSAGPRRTTSPLLGFAATIVVLGATCLLRRDWLDPRLARVHDLVAAPLHGMAVVLALLPAAGLLAYAAMSTGDLPPELSGDSDDGSGVLGARRRLALGVLGVGNAGLAFLGVGSGGRLGARGAAGSAGDLDLGYVGDFVGRPGLAGRDAADLSWWGRLATLHDHTDMWGLWLAVPATLLLLGVAAWVVTSATRRAPRPWQPLSLWCATMLIAFPLLARGASVHAGARLDARYVDGWGGEGGGHLAVDAYAGLAPVDALLLALLGTLITVVVASSRGLLVRNSS